MLWALVPLFTLGLGTPFVLAWAAHRLRSRGLALSALAALIMMIAALSLSGSPDGSGGSTAAGWFIVALIGGGLTATFVTRPRLVDPGHSSRRRAGSEVRGSAWSPRTDRPVPGAVDPAVGAALVRRQRRAEARNLLESDPALARELLIGRPDLPRRFDDGGLVDVNHAPVSVLTTLPGFTPELAERVAQARDKHHGFDFVGELEVYADLPQGLADELAERLIFLR
ncbi:helix-hairpin-helix domain-containing protein [Streptomyces flavidovirens]|uniref:ComEA family DNA-binding protein n=1 Tax=Streptomyces flavidovirens TaxID=67298 RepID=UPI0033A67679